MDVMAWMRAQGISAELYDANELLRSFEQEMSAGLNGEPSSLAMIPSYISSGADLPKHEPVAVIDAGGTNLRVCLVSFSESGSIELLKYTKQPMPGRDHEISAATFYKVVVDALEPFADQFSRIGFCFSYPAEIQPNLDGRLLQWTKEVKIPELVGKEVGTGLIDALRARGISGKSLVMLNDTVATLLAGVVQGEQFNASTYIGFILGTGTNTAYAEKNENIGKLAEGFASGVQVINVESGGFSAFKRAPIDLELDAASENPGGHVFEKLLSGGYMSPLTLALFKQLAREGGGFSAPASEAVLAMKSLYIVDIGNLVRGNGHDIGFLGTDCFTAEDHEIMRRIFTCIVRRAALLTAVNIAAAVIKSGEGTDPERPVCVNIDGSTYYLTVGMEGLVQDYLKELLGARGLYIRCVQVDDAPVAGAAIAALTSFAG
jgi:hexokinase